MDSTTTDPQAVPAATNADPPVLRHKVRIVTATSLFDGHDAAINIMRRLLHRRGAEVIHLGHDRSVAEIVDAAIQEDAQGICVSSYQGGHMEFFRYAKDLLAERGSPHVKIFGGGGGVIVPSEIEALHKYGIDRIFSPDDGRTMGLQGMIDHVLEACDFDPLTSGPGGSALGFEALLADATSGPRGVARAISRVEQWVDGKYAEPELWPSDDDDSVRCTVVGITGTGGAGKSTVTDEVVRRFLQDQSDRSVAILAVDPTRRRTGGALLGDRIRMNSVAAAEPHGDPRVFMRSMATRQRDKATSAALRDAVEVCRRAGYDLVIVETAGIGQSNSEVTDLVDLTVYVMTAEYGAASQLEKIDMLDLADLVVLNKYEKRESEDALRDIRKQVCRNRDFQVAAEDAPVYPTIASQFGDPGTSAFYVKLVEAIADRCDNDWVAALAVPPGDAGQVEVVPRRRQRYLEEIADCLNDYRSFVEKQAETATNLAHLTHAIRVIEAQDAGLGPALEREVERLRGEQDPSCAAALEGWEDLRGPTDPATEPGGEEIVRRSLAGTAVPRVAMPRYRDPGDRLRWLLTENLPGHFPFTAGVFPLKREGEDPTRMFAGEGSPERTNRRFHYLSRGQKSARLSTAFDSVTLYGRDPALRPDIYGKIGNSGVSICTLDDAKKLYCGFDLCEPTTSVSMTINGPAPTVLAMFMNAAIDQQVERHLREAGRLDEIGAAIAEEWRAQGQAPPAYVGEDRPEGDRAFGLGLLGSSGDRWVDPEVYESIVADTMGRVRGTVQADILKEDQAQNTCIFSIDFALRMMGDIQEELIRRNARNYYSVSISGYHIAEAGANPITQVAFTLANGFTYVEAYLARGMDIDAFAPSLSFFFSNGLDPEYAVIGRVARRIWAVAMRERYGGDQRSQRLKYHIQTSGRSLHAQEIEFNDVRTTLQALYAFYDNCNSLHTNAYDEAITTPTEASVRRALAIQLIIQRELGMSKNENPLQGAFVIDELTDLVEEAVLAEFRRISRRGGVLGAMETDYQRGKIQEESLTYETMKSSGELPIIGVNTFTRSDTQQPTSMELMRSTETEKRQQLDNLAAFHGRHGDDARQALARLRVAAAGDGNLFRELMGAVKVASLGQVTETLFEVGGRYRRAM